MTINLAGVKSMSDQWVSITSELGTFEICVRPPTYGDRIASHSFLVAGQQGDDVVKKAIAYATIQRERISGMVKDWRGVGAPLAVQANPRQDGAVAEPMMKEVPYSFPELQKLMEADPAIFKQVREAVEQAFYQGPTKN